MEQRHINLALKSVLAVLTMYFKLDFPEVLDLVTSPNCFAQTAIPSLLNSAHSERSMFSTMFLIHWQLTHSVAVLAGNTPGPTFTFKGILLPTEFGRVWYSCKEGF